jgi:glycine C-acetyltransferase
MTLAKLKGTLDRSLMDLKTRGIRKGEEHVITGVQPATGGRGPRCFLAGYEGRCFLRLNSNSYLGLSMHPQVIAAEEKAARIFGTGPGAVRFISGTYGPHIELENRLAEFHGRQAGMIFSAAYATIMGVLPQLITGDTVVLSDSLNHNCIINALRLAKPAQKLIYRHLDMAELETKIRDSVGQGSRALVVTDGIFSMRGDYAPLDEISAICRKYDESFSEGIITVVDDSHGVGAFGQTRPSVLTAATWWPTGQSLISCEKPRRSMSIQTRLLPLRQQQQQRRLNCLTAAKDETCSSGYSS